jgi:glycosyltransferase involved in cell wall biosynthesis
MNKYVIITPVRDEEEFIKFTLESVVSQTVRPVEWVIVDDGSKDGTGEILEEYAARFGWIKVVKRGDRGCRKAGGGVIEAFYDGYAAISATDWDFIVKLDGDLSFPPDYFERCFQEFRENPRLGICGGKIFNLINGVPVGEPAPLFHVRGATKIYGRKCWDQIGGLIAAPGWDTLDEVKANMLGWNTCTLPELELIHYRPTGAADGDWKNAFKNGRANYISGYHPVFMLLKCLKRLFKPPYIVETAGLLSGYISGYLLRIHRVPDPKLIRYLRRQQLRKLVGLSSLWN